jgi:hypothetical protein
VAGNGSIALSTLAGSITLDDGTAPADGRAVHAHGTGASPKAVEAGLTRFNIQRGGIVGSVEIVDCVTDSDSHWFMGLYGFVLRDPLLLPFTPWRGQLGFFDVPLTMDQLAAGPVAA